MSTFDLLVRGGSVFANGRLARVNVAVRDGRIAALTADAPDAATVIDATGRLVLPGGIDVHCHIAQTTSTGATTADDFHEATVGAAFGGTTLVMPFAAQHRGQSLRDSVSAYRERAAGRAVVDYAFHMIVTDPNPTVLETELPALVSEGFTSVKLYMTYDALRVDDRQLLETLLHARRLGVLPMIHAESHDMIGWLTERLLSLGYRHPRHLAHARPALAEREATFRAIGLAELLDIPVFIVHVSSAAAAAQIAAAQRSGLPVFAETCPQYLLLTERDLDRPFHEAVKYCCSPPPRSALDHGALWDGLRDGLFSCFSSDHSVFRLDGPHGKRSAGDEAPFNRIPYGLPGLETRLPLLFSEGVNRGRLSLERFVELSAAGPARLFGMAGRKGVIAPGADADLAIWDPDARTTLSAATLHDGAGYTVYEGTELRGLPVTTISRGVVVCDAGRLLAQPGHGRLVACERAPGVGTRPAPAPWLA
ncbi:dihydropyrimidinase [Paraburkholderia caballeronis]|uniref:dihydropyrimidinase n=1 Tax=Paraburkholderia caballeronis TaxID=416943 RepID=UPI00106562C7|nr:dihydropyrimidinase [Paraburkholderia caballeronis]TDV35571.1 dihydropyrimidinase [Paraburkholderia caballeronis]